MKSPMSYIKKFIDDKKTNSAQCVAHIQVTWLTPSKRDIIDQSEPVRKFRIFMKPEDAKLWKESLEAAFEMIESRWDPCIEISEVNS